MKKKKEKEKDPAAVSLGRRGGYKRAKKLTPKQRSDSARKAALERWKKIREYRDTPPEE